MEKRISEKRRFWILRRLSGANHGARGIRIMLVTTPNAWVELAFGFLSVYLGIILSISTVEWAILVLAIGFVIVTETLNTAIEIDINLTSPQYHQYARDTKDVAAGAVFISIVIAIVIGLIIFLPKILALT